MANPVKQFAQYFDHTNLSLSSSHDDIVRLCEEALEYNFYSVVVYPGDVYICKMTLDGSDVKIGTVIGFPHGRTLVDVKEAEIVLASKQGADEVDIVMDYTMLKAGHFDQACNEIRQLSRIAKLENLISKVIVETSELNDKEKLQALKICESSEVNFIKTSTGFSSHGALVEDVKLFSDHKEYIGVKASGGIKTLEQTVKMIKAGATRIGTSSTVSIMKEFSKKHTASNLLTLDDRRNN